ncbi:MAG: DUF4920 domain-containing protein [Phycisphaerales bacterium]|nr:DUF4920 domain-containing protein [Phycisphaerales bacterium]
MRRLTCLTILTAMLATGCARTASDKAMRSGWSGYGDAQAVKQRATSIPNLAARSGQTVVMEAWIDDVCAVKGCWMRVRDEQGDEVLVRFLDYGFFVPRNARGRRVVAHGVPEVRALSVEQQRHLLEDAGAAEEAILAITEPKTETIMIADGVWIQGEGLDLPYAPEVVESCPLDEEVSEVVEIESVPEEDPTPETESPPIDIDALLIPDTSAPAAEPTSEEPGGA